MPELTAEEFAQRALAVELLDQQQLAALWTELGTTDVSLEEFQN
jgi:hypothetical protein